MMFSLALALMAQTPVATGWFPFVVPWDSSRPGSITDVSFLNEMPAGKNGRIIRKGNHFVEERTGRQVRFLGTNMAGDAAFPSHADADKIASRLASLGINVCRFHHLQADWTAAAGNSIWKADKLYREFNPDAVDRMDYFVAALKKKGIYSNINLQTTRKYLPEMGFPQSVLQIPDICKKIDKVDRKMIEFQKQYARDLIGRTNPYTGMKYSEDPAIAFIEINNENSLVGWPGEAPGATLNGLPEYFRNEIQAAWSKWLLSKYNLSSRLAASWKGSNSSSGGAPLTSAASQWVLENHSNGDVEFTTSKGVSAPNFRVNVKSNAGPDWHVQARIGGINFIEGQTYTLTFKAKSDVACTIPVSATLDESDWHNIGLATNAEVGQKERVFAYSFVATDVHENHNRVGFVLGKTRGVIEVSDLRVVPGMVEANIPTDASLKAGTVPLPDAGSKQQMADYAAFLADTETAFSTEMRGFLHKELGFKSNLVDSQVSWGGLTSLKREAQSDYADNHAYFQHPSFPGASWDASNWVIGNVSMVSGMRTGYGELSGLAQYRFADRPYSISEYNHPAPNDFRAEMMPLYSSFAALQDWDAIYTFDYGATGKGFKNDQIQGFFAVSTDPAKVAFHPAAALMFRQGLVPTAVSKATLTFDKDVPWTPDFNAWTAWSKSGFKSYNTHATGIQTSKGVSKPILLADKPSESVIKTTSRPSGVIYSVNAPEAKSLVGLVGGQTFALDNITVTFPKFGDNFAAMTLTAMDKLPFAKSKSVLLTLVGKVENQEMGWNKDRTSVGNQWGHGPVIAEGIPCKVSLPGKIGYKVYALNASGKRDHQVISVITAGMIVFTVSPTDRTLWYEISGN